MLLHEGYPNKLPEIKDTTNVINFDVPSSYNIYKQNANYVDSELGSVLTFVQPENNDQITGLTNISQKI